MVTRIGTRLPALIALVALLGFGMTAERAQAQAPTTASARALHDSVGVNAAPHFLTGPYGDWNRALGMLRELDVRHIRTALLNSNNAGWNGAVYDLLRQTMRAASA